MIISENFKVLVFISWFLKMKYVVRAHTRAIKRTEFSSAREIEETFRKPFIVKKNEEYFI